MSDEDREIDCNDNRTPTEAQTDHQRKRTRSPPNENEPPTSKTPKTYQDISWGKHNTIPLTPPNTPPTFTTQSPALCLHIHARSGHARASTLHLPHGPLPLPVFMPVGTKGTVKAMTSEELDLYDISLILGNTYHLAMQPGTELIRDLGGLHEFMNYGKNLLTDSGGFQMVSLLKFTEIGEEGVHFTHPTSKKKLLLRPEDSIRHQNNIGADIIMALDDVVSSVTEDPARFREATDRTIRWFDRCWEAHTRKRDQNLFPIVQGGLDCEEGGLRERCLRAFRERDDRAPGYAIGGLAGGESKPDFFRVVHMCCRALPDGKPRYLMGVGYPLDIVVCTGLGVDMYDCVYPTRTARFGAAFINGKHPGTLRLKNSEFRTDERLIDETCPCQACRGGQFTRSRLHSMLKGKNESLAVQLMTHHNLAYMMTLMKDIRRAIMDGVYEEFARGFVKRMYPERDGGGEDVPSWLGDALELAGISLGDD